MMARRRRRLRQAFRHTAQELRKWSKTRLIRLILRLEAARISRTVRRLTRNTKRARGQRSTKKLRPGIHNVLIKGKTRRVKVLRNGQWRFLKNKARGSTRKRRRATRARRARRR